MGEVEIKVKLIEYTPNPEKVVAMAAKLCYSPSDIDDIMHGVTEKDQSKFLQKLVDMGHLSTIEHVNFTFGIEGVSRSLLAQITRHRIASFSVKSQRYVRAGNDGECFNYIIPSSIRGLGDEYVIRFKQQMEEIQKWYDEWVDILGNTGEDSYQDARFVLPNAAETKMILTMNARELLHFFRLRCCNRAQWEIRALAKEMLKEVQKVAPNLFKDAGPGCLTGVCPEGRMTCGRAKEVREEFLGMEAE